MKRFFTEKEVKDLVRNYEVETIRGEDRRWLRTNTTIVNVDGKFYELQWEQGLTEYQDNEYFGQEANEVKKKTITRTITEEIWENVD